ncbi:MAG: FAD-binding oxidoreductase [Acidimicrobiia bacterium]
MAGIRSLNGDGSETEVEPEAIAALGETLRGRLLTADDGEYGDARQIWNGMIDRRPSLIARCIDTADVMHSVHFAREHGLLVSVKGGGHNVAGKAVCDGAFMLDLSLMNRVRVDQRGSTARAQGGAKWTDFDRETQAFGLATTGGTLSDTGIAGLTLGGGLGWLAGQHGLSCDNLVSADVVLADGSVVVASDDDNQDLFWALRGGSGNFGVVTAFEYRLHPVSVVLGGAVFHPLSEAANVLRFYGEFTAEIPNELNTMGVLLHTPEGLPVAAIAACYNGPIDAGEKVLDPVRKFGPPLVDQFQPLPYGIMQTLFDPAFPPGGRYYWKAHLVGGVSEEAIEILAESYQRVPSPGTALLFQQLGNAANRVAPEATAFSHRHARYDLVLLSAWSDPADDDKNIGWTRELWDALEPSSLGAIYVKQRRRRRRSHGAVRLPGRHIPPPHRAQGEVRPGELLQAEPEHQTRAGLARDST